jgi:hypothetical protein
MIVLLLKREMGINNLETDMLDLQCPIAFRCHKNATPVPCPRFQFPGSGFQLVAQHLVTLGSSGGRSTPSDTCRHIMVQIFLKFNDAGPGMDSVRQEIRNRYLAVMEGTSRSKSALRQLASEGRPGQKHSSSRPALKLKQANGIPPHGSQQPGELKSTMVDQIKSDADVKLDRIRRITRRK